MRRTDKQIQDHDWLYAILRPTVDFLFHRSVRRYLCLGKENLPTDGHIIYAPNHQNGLLDALAILSLDNKPKVFVSRADIHRNPRISKILSWLKIMPIHRMRDGIDSVRHNDEVMSKAVSVLHDGVPFCIMPEGTHRRKHSLLPLQKGIFRIAMQAVKDCPVHPTYIVPVGLEYGDWDHMWHSITICIGKPICVNDYLRQHPEQTEPQQILGLRELLTQRMQSLMLYVPDDEHYDEAWARLDQNRPAPWQRPRHRLPRWSRLLLLLLGAPLFLLTGLLTFPIWIVLCIIQPKLEDVAIRNSVEFVWTWIMILCSLGLTWPLWCYVQEYLYQIRTFSH